MHATGSNKQQQQQRQDTAQLQLHMMHFGSLLPFFRYIFMHFDRLALVVCWLASKLCSQNSRKVNLNCQVRLSYAAFGFFLLACCCAFCMQRERRQFHSSFSDRRLLACC